MDLKRKAQSLKLVFIKYLITVAFSLFVAIALAMVAFNGFLYGGFIVPANYTEKQISANKTTISTMEDFDDSLIPDRSSYVYLSLDGDVIETDMDEELKNKAIAFHRREVASTPSLSFIEIKRDDGYVIVHYSLQPYYTRPWMEMYFPKVDYLFVLLLVVFSFISIFIITMIWARKLTKQLKPMLEASEKITKKDLDFQMGKSNIKEFNDVLSGMDEMKRVFSDSLRKNWMEEEGRKTRISALTHDLKTPIAIVQGNAELLKETPLTKEQESHLDYIIKNIHRISDYTKSLMLMNQANGIEETLQLEKLPVSTVVKIATDYAKEMILVGHRELMTDIHIDDRWLLVDVNLFKRVFQNILSNAIDYSPKESHVTLSVSMTDTMLNISVSDQGQGFSEEDLRYGMEPFYRGDKSRHSSTNYGLGLYISAQIMKLHKGKVTIKNKTSEEGSVVTLTFPLL